LKLTILRTVVCPAMLFSAVCAVKAQPPKPSFVIPHGERLTITNVELIDGTGGPVLRDQTVVLRGDHIEAVGPTSSVTIAAGVETLDGTGKTVIPGLVGMHEHMFYPSPVRGPLVAMSEIVSFPQLYLASGVTTARTTGSMDPYGDLQMKKAIDSGEWIGPDLDLTTPYLQGGPGPIPQLHVLTGPDDARSMVAYWNSLGFTSVKAYDEITAAELKAAIDEAHKRHMKVTGHLCSVGFDEAVTMGIDNLEHGPFGAPDGDLYAKKKTDECAPESGPGGSGAVFMSVVTEGDPAGARLQHTIQLMIEHHVPLTSTLAVMEGGSAVSLKEDGRLHDLLYPVAWTYIVAAHEREVKQDALFAMLMKKEMAFERAFVAAGGTLMTGCDPTGDGHTLAGLGDQRNLELLSKAGFSTPEVIRIATLNGATYEGLSEKLGTVAVGKRADLVVLNGDLAEDITVIERPDRVFKAGVAYDSNRIYESLKGQVGLH
jgi:imidazolonepropionase-like amidohydrolase